jgi:O-antigen/teichoic acid export membrane protein
MTNPFDPAATTAPDLATPSVSRRARFFGALRRADWQFFKSSAMTTLGIVVARVLGFCYSFLLARAFSADAFGSIQYTITLATLAALTTVPFAEQVLPWFISRSRGDQRQLAEVLRHAALVLALLYGITLVTLFPVLGMLDRPAGIVAVIFSGITLFNLYVGLARGFLAPGRLLLVYLGSNLLQLGAVLIALRVFGTSSTTPALLIYGLSYVLPIMLLETVRPLPIVLGPLRFGRAKLYELLRFGAPVWGSHALYTLSWALDVLLLEWFWGEATVGVYTLTRTIVMGFSFVPQGITVMLMPRVAGSTGQEQHSLLRSALLATAAVSALGLVVYGALYQWFVVSLVGRLYFVGLWFGMLMAVSAIIYGFHAIVTSYVVGNNQPGLETASRATMGVVLLAAGLLLVPSQGVIGAAWANLLCAISGIAAYLILLIRQRWRTPSPQP